MNFDIDPITANWPLPEALPLFESESANDANRPSRWERFKARCAEIVEAIENPFTLRELDSVHSPVGDSSCAFGGLRSESAPDRTAAPIELERPL